MRVHVSGLLLLTFSVVAPAAGCAGTVAGGPGTGDAEVSSTNAVVLVERTLDTNEGSRAAASARFVRVAAPSTADDALEAIGAALDLPPAGSCASLASLAGVAAGVPGERPLIELFDVGSVSLEASGVETHLSPRQLPDVTDVVSGIVYARAADPSLFPAAARYSVHISGSVDLDPIDTTLTAPADPTDVRVVGEDGHGGAELASGTPIELVWPVDAPGTSDVIYVDVRPDGGTSTRCVVAPDGDAGDPDGLSHATISFAFLSDERGTLVIHRVRREALHARGLDAGEVRFDFARAIAYRR